MTAPAKSLERNCLVTVGATVGFRKLTQTVLQPTFWHYLCARGFTSLRIQCGPDISWAAAQRSQNESRIPAGLDVVVFDVCRNLMKEEMSRCRAVQGSTAQGLVISHAGTGTILDAWRLGLPIVVVPNTDLLDDHQTEMAEHLAKKGYATMSSSSPDDLQEAIHKSELLWEDNKSRWPPNSISRGGGGAKNPGDDGARGNHGGGMRLWDIAVTGKPPSSEAEAEVEREQNAQMTHD